jgi:hypothetical protein
MYHGSHPLSAVLQPTEKSLDPINPGESGSIVLRQYVSREVAQSLSRMNPLALESGKCALWFSYTDSKGNAQKLRYAFQHQITDTQTPSDI